MNTRCLLFDNLSNNHSENEKIVPMNRDGHLDRILRALEIDSHYGTPAWYHPLTTILALVRECKWSCSVRQETLNDYIISTERATNTATWTNEPQLSPWRSDFMAKTVKLQLYRTNLNIVTDSLEFLLGVWDFVSEWSKGNEGFEIVRRDCGPSCSSESLAGLLWGTLSQEVRIEALDDLSFERFTTSRMKSQLESLRGRYEAQSGLVSNPRLTSRRRIRLSKEVFHSLTRLFRKMRVGSPPCCLSSH